MRFSILSALFVSVALIGGAGWFKTTNVKNPPQTITPVDRASDSGLDTYTPTSVADLSANSLDEGGANLTTTDLVGRQLISDYLSLAGGSDVSEESLTKLGEKYANSIAEIESSTKIDPSTLTTVSDTKANLEKYSEELSLVENSRVDELNRISENESVANESLIYKTAGDISSIYEDAGERLMSISVPSSLLTLHTNLVNSYLSVSAGMKSLSKVEEDSVLSFAGVISAQSGIKAGQTIVRDIVEILIKNDAAS